MSEFDDLMLDADDAIWGVFGGVVTLVEGDVERTVEAMIERNVSVERFEKGRSSVRLPGRVSDQILVSFRSKNVPANASVVRVVLDGKRWKLDDPVVVDGDIEYLLVLEVVGESVGGAGAAFINFP